MAASWAFARGTTIPLSPNRLAVAAIGKTPATGRRLPSRDISPTKTKSPSNCGSTCSEAAKIPIPMGRSKLGPSFRRSAGVKLITIFRMGKANPAFLRAALTLSRDSWTAVSGKPTTVMAGSPPDTSTSTPTCTASTPIREALQTLANIIFAFFGNYGDSDWLD